MLEPNGAGAEVDPNVVLLGAAPNTGAGVGAGAEAGAAVPNVGAFAFALCVAGAPNAAAPEAAPEKRGFGAGASGLEEAGVSVKFNPEEVEADGGAAGAGAGALNKFVMGFADAGAEGATNPGSAPAGFASVLDSLVVDAKFMVNPDDALGAGAADSGLEVAGARLKFKPAVVDGGSEGLKRRYRLSVWALRGVNEKCRLTIGQTNVQI